MSVTGTIQCKNNKERIAETKELQRKHKGVKISREDNLIIYYYETNESVY
jgi:hypothetical protein